MALASIRFGAVDQASEVIDRIAKKLGNLTNEGGFVPSFDVSNLPDGLRQISSLQGAMGALGNMGPWGKAASIGLEVGQTVWELGEMGASVMRTRDAFTDMAASAGTSGASVLQAMRRASAGTVADSELMAAANRAMVLGVADSAEELGQLTAAAITKGRKVGVGAVQAVNDLINGIGRMSPEILDNLGIANAKGAFDAYAASLGTTADKLTEVQKKQALVNAALEGLPQGAVVAADAAASFEKMDASLTNLKETLGVAFGPLVAAVADALAQGVSGIDQLLDPLEGKLPLEDLGRIDRQIMAAAAEVQRLQGPEFTPSDAVTNAIAQQQDLIVMYEQARNQLLGNAGATVTYAGALERATAAVARADYAARAAAGGWNEQAAAAQQAAQQAAATQTEMQELAAKFGTVGALALRTATDVATLTAEINRLQGIASAIAGARSGAIGRAEALALEAVTQYGANWEDVAPMLTDAEGAINGMILATDGSSAATVQNQIKTQKALGTLQDYVEGLREADRAAHQYAASGLKSMDQAYSSLQGKVQSLLQQSLTLDVDWPGKDAGLNGGSGDAINENAKRLAAIANEGLIGQGWLDEFAAEAPSTYADLMLKIAAGMDARGAAQQLMAEFQAGMRPDLLDFGQLKEQVKQQLIGEQALSGMADQLTAELVAEMDGVSAGQVQSALAGILGSTPGGALAAQDLDLGGAGDGAGASLRGGIVAGFEADGMALEILAKIDAEFAAEKKGVEDSGKAVGAVWGGGFMSTVGNNIPVGLLDLFTAKLLPMILASLALQGSRTGAES